MSLRRAGRLPSPSSVRSILRGAALALRDPRRLATLGQTSNADRQAAFQREAIALGGDVPRCVPIEAILDVGGDALPAFTFLDDTSTVLDLLLLRALVKRYDAGTMLEIGTFRGESALAVAAAGASVVTISLPDRALVEAGASESWVGAHRTMSCGHPAIRHVFGHSGTIDTAPYQNWADILFIDGDHSRAAVEMDTRRFWSVRSAAVGAVVWHDAFHSPLVPRWEVIAGILAGVPVECRSRLVHVSNTLCLTLLPDGESLPTVPRSYIPRTAFSVTIAPLRSWRSGKLESQSVEDIGLHEEDPPERCETTPGDPR